MAVRGSFLEEVTAAFFRHFVEPERANNGGWTQVEYFLNDVSDFLVGDFACAECGYMHGYRSGNADCIGNLHFAARGDAGADDVFCHPAHCISCRAVHFSWIFARECAAAVACVAAVGVDDNFATGQAGVAMQSADDKASRVNQMAGLIVRFDVEILENGLIT